MTSTQRIELELCLDLLNEAIADIARITLKRNIPLYNNDELGIYYINLINKEHQLRKTDDYNDVLHAKDIIKTAQANVIKLKIFNGI